MVVLYSLDYGCFVVSFVIRKSVSYFVLLFQYCLYLLKFYMAFKISLLISQIHSLGDGDFIQASLMFIIYFCRKM